MTDQFGFFKGISTVEDLNSVITTAVEAIDKLMLVYFLTFQKVGDRIK